MARGIPRKRKRSAVDPCLGYYAEQQESVEAQALPVSIPVDSRSAFQTAPPRIVAFDQAVKSLDRESRPPLADGASNSAAGDSFISVEGFLRGNAKASLRRGEVPTSRRNSAFVRLKQRKVEPVDDPQLRSTVKTLSPIESEISPLRPRSAVDWVFDIKAPLTAGTILGQDEHDELQSEHGSLPDIAILDPGSITEDLGSQPPSTQQTLRLRTRDIHQKDLLDRSQSEAYTTDSDSGQPISHAKHKRKKRKVGKVRFKSLGTRLFEAGVGTHGNPMDSLLVPPQAGRKMTRSDETEIERKPLPFIPVEDSSGTPTSGSLVVNKKHLLVDPHCIEPFRTAYFGPPMKLHGKTSSQEVAIKIGQSSSIVYKTLSDWQPKLDKSDFHEAPSQKRVRGRRKRGLQKEGQAPPEIAYAPLEFVPLSEALSSRKNRQSHRASVENRTV